MDTHGLQKKGYKFYCENCLHGSNNKKDFVRHLSTTKHLKSYKKSALDASKIPLSNTQINNSIRNPLRPKVSKGINGINPQKSPQHFQCNCGKQYVYRQGLYKHQKICLEYLGDKNLELDECSNLIVTTTLPNDSDLGNLKDLVVLLLKENKEIQKILLI